MRLFQLPYMYKCQFLNVLITLISSLLLITSCTVERPSSENLLSINLGSIPSTFDLHLSREANSGYVNLNTMQGLFAYDFNSGSPQLVPQLLESYSSNENKDEWQFCIKENVLWGDGHPLKVGHFIKSWKRLLKPSTGSPHAYRMFLIKGAKEFHENKLPFDKVSIKAIDRQCFKVSLQKGSSLFPHLLTAPFTFPIRHDLLKHKNWPYLPGACIGDYVWQEHDNHQRSLLIAHPNREVHDKRPAKVELIWLESFSTALSLFKKQKIDIIKSPDLGMLNPQIIKESYIQKAGSGITFLAFNTKDPLGRNLKFRQQIKSLLNRDRLVKVLGLNYKPQVSLWPKWISPLKTKKTEKTKVLKTKSHSVKHNNSVIKIGSNSSRHNKLIVNFISHEISEILANPIELQLSSTHSYFNALKTNPFTLYRYSWTPAGLDPYFYIEIFHSESEHNHTAHQSRLLDKLIEAARVELDQRERLKLYEKINDYILNKQALVLPLVLKEDSYLVNKDKWIFESQAVDRILFSSLQKK